MHWSQGGEKGKRKKLDWIIIHFLPLLPFYSFTQMETAWNETCAEGEEGAIGTIFVSTRYGKTRLIQRRLLLAINTAFKECRERRI